MSHRCPAALITCEDFRLHQRQDGRNYVADLLKNISDCDLITRAGGVQDLVRPAQPGFDKSLLRDIGVSVNLHNASTIYLLNHEDCGAYSSFGFSSREAELEQHKEDLLAAKELILKQFPGKEIKLFFAELEPGSGDKFLIKEIV